MFTIKKLELLAQDSVIQDFVLWAAKNTFFFVFGLFIFTALTWVLVKAFFIEIDGKNYFSRVSHEWLEFAMSIGMFSWTFMTGLLYYLVVPPFFILFLWRQDLLGKNLDKNSFWENAKDVSFDLKRNYRQY